MANRWPVSRAIGLAGLCLLAGCSGSSRPAASGAPASGIPITVSLNTCGNSWQQPAPGLLTFEVRNAAQVPVDVSLTNPGTGGVYAEIEALGPGTTRSLQADVGSGSYAFQCDTGYGNPLTGSTTVIPGHATAASPSPRQTRRRRSPRCPVSTRT